MIIKYVIKRRDTKLYHSDDFTMTEDILQARFYDTLESAELSIRNQKEIDEVKMVTIKVEEVEEVE